MTFEISGELSCYKQESISIESRLPENACRGLHARYESAELMFTDAVCEKTFAVNEQFSFPGRQAEAVTARVEQGRVRCERQPAYRHEGDSKGKRGACGLLSFR